MSTLDEQATMITGIKLVYGEHTSLDVARSVGFEPADPYDFTVDADARADEVLATLREANERRRRHDRIVAAMRGAR